MLSTSSRKITAAAAAGVVVLALAACGGSEPEPTEPAASTQATESPSAPETESSAPPSPSEGAQSSSGGDETRPSPTAADPAGEYSTQARMSEGFPDPLAPALEGENLTLDDVRIGQHAGFDRIVFAHAGGQPGWRAEYTDQPALPGSGQEVELDGEAVLAIHLTGLRPGMGGAQEGHTVLDTTWPDHDTVVQQTMTTSVFEGAATYFIGLDEQRPFAIEQYDDGRLVIDFRTD
ncbi:AMIN-like domain-containing (lipo)protein [Zhihengliuella flava]|uniref:AMIN-like domain-containing protein n=1 Tax=Zhihengliuella flava TaxID=1285193 RepID=A0A931D865_9MICC|nr:hypothetical protein [Zhihengliuella flava]MBG6084202.1 hypothetical protein [Zhihengliuella flava]